MKIRLNTLIDDIPGHAYHAVPGTYSSSQIKDIIEDDELFHKKYITKEFPRQSIAAFDVGTYFHTGILEPHKLNDECIVYPGAVRRGAEYEAFAREHSGKCIVTKKEQADAENLIEAVLQSPVAKELLSNARPEVSVFTKLWVDTVGERIFTRARGQWFYLKPIGWGKVIGDTDVSDCIPLVVKARADALDSNRHHIVDLKSTSGNAKNPRTVRQKISAFKYDLSAALYLDLFSLTSEEPYDKFYWTFASKDYRNTRTWLATEDNIKIGRAKWAAGALALARGIKDNWKFIDCIGLAEPEYYEREWLK